MLEYLLIRNTLETKEPSLYQGKILLKLQEFSFKKCDNKTQSYANPKGKEYWCSGEWVYSLCIDGKPGQRVTCSSRHTVILPAVTRDIWKKCLELFPGKAEIHLKQFWKTVRSLLMGMNITLQFNICGSVHHALYWWNKSDKMQQLRFLFAVALLYMFRVTISPIIRSTMLYMATGELAHLGCY